MSLCRFVRDGDWMVCPCGNRMPVDPRWPEPWRYRMRCLIDRPPQQLKPARKRAGSTGLGDYTERMLAKIGVTQERYVEAKRLFGLSPTCGCAKRKRWLNKVSDWWRAESPPG